MHTPELLLQPLPVTGAAQGGCNWAQIASDALHGPHTDDSGPGSDARSHVRSALRAAEVVLEALLPGDLLQQLHPWPPPPPPPPPPAVPPLQPPRAALPQGHLQQLQHQQQQVNRLPGYDIGPQFQQQQHHHHHQQQHPGMQQQTQRQPPAVAYGDDDEDDFDDAMWDAVDKAVEAAAAKPAVAISGAPTAGPAVTGGEAGASGGPQEETGGRQVWIPLFPDVEAEDEQPEQGLGQQQGHAPDTCTPSGPGGLGAETGAGPGPEPAAAASLGLGQESVRCATAADLLAQAVQRHGAGIGLHQQHVPYQHQHQRQHHHQHPQVYSGHQPDYRWRQDQQYQQQPYGHHHQQHHHHHQHQHQQPQQPQYSSHGSHATQHVLLDDEDEGQVVVDLVEEEQGGEAGGWGGQVPGYPLPPATMQQQGYGYGTPHGYPQHQEQQQQHPHTTLAPQGLDIRTPGVVCLPGPSVAAPQNDTPLVSGPGSTCGPKVPRGLSGPADAGEAAELAGPYAGTALPTHRAGPDPGALRHRGGLGVEQERDRDAGGSGEEDAGAAGELEGVALTFVESEDEADQLDVGVGLALVGVDGEEQQGGNAGLGKGEEAEGDEKEEEEELGGVELVLMDADEEGGGYGGDGMDWAALGSEYDTMEPGGAAAAARQAHAAGEGAAADGFESDADSDLGGMSCSLVFDSDADVDLDDVALLREIADMPGEEVDELRDAVRHAVQDAVLQGGVSAAAGEQAVAALERAVAAAAAVAEVEGGVGGGAAGDAARRSARGGPMGGKRRREQLWNQYIRVRGAGKPSRDASCAACSPVQPRTKPSLAILLQIRYISAYFLYMLYSTAKAIHL